MYGVFIAELGLVLVVNMLPDIIFHGIKNSGLSS
jgi:hypothetical protein